jgi:thiamine-monophosphate kinase
MTSLKDIGEFKLINKIKKGFSAKSKDILLGIGDDCAVIKKDDKTVSLISTDALVEGVHFNPDFFTPIQLGMKSAAVNISDIAAMGGTPKYILVSLAIPEKISYEFVRDFYTGIKRVCTKYDVKLAGGDTSTSKSGLFISISVIGEAPVAKYLTRKGANPGDFIYVSGRLGDSAGGLLLLLNKHKIGEGVRRYLVNKHLKVTPRVKEGLFLAKSGYVTSMIDLSDGIGSDVTRICDESGVGAKIYINMLPVSKYLKKLSRHLNKNVYDFALHGGEDYELLFTVKTDCEEKLETCFKKHFKKKIFKIGAITKKTKIRSIDSSDISCDITDSYNHFLMS